MKKSMIKKLLSIVLALALVASFAGCGEKGKKGKTDVEVPTSEKVDEITFAGLKFKPNPDLDFGGKTVKMSHWSTTIPEEGYNKVWDDRYAIKEVIEKKYNVKVEYVPVNTSNFIEDVTTSYASGTLFADLIFLPSENLMQLSKIEGIFRPLDDYIDYSNERFALTKAYAQSPDGKNYSYTDLDIDPGLLVFYNPDIIADSGCEDPLELYKAGKWDWDAFLNIIKSTTKMSGGKQQYGITGSNLLDGLMASNGLPVIQVDTANKGYKCNLYTDAGMEVLDFIREITYVNHGADETYGSHNGIETFNNGLAAMMISPNYYGANVMAKGTPLEMVPLPQGPSAKGDVNMLDFCNCNVISSLSEFKTEDLLQLAFDLQRNDPEIGDTYVDDSYEGKLNEFIVEQLDTENDYYDEEQATRIYDYINDKNTIQLIDKNTTDIKAIIKKNIYSPISKGEDPRSILTSVKSVIEQELKKYSAK